MSRTAIGWSLALISLVLLGYLARTHLADWRALLELSPGSVLAVASLYLLARVCGALGVRRGLQQLGFTIGRLEACMLSLVSSYTNLLLPRTGVASLALYLKRSHGVRVTSYLSLSVTILLLSAVVCGLCGAFVQLVFTEVAGRPLRLDVLLLFIAAGGAASALLMLPPELFERAPERFRVRLSGVHEAWHGMARRWGVLGHIMALHLMAALLRALRLQIVFSAVGSEISFPVALLGSLLADLATLISVTPGALGFREAALAYSASLLGVAPAVAILAALVDRLICSAAVIVLGQLSVWRTFGGLGAVRRDEAEAAAESR